MTSFDSLLIVLGVLYLLDVWIWAPPNAVLFRSIVGGRFRVHVVGDEGVRLRPGGLFTFLGWLPFSRAIAGEITPYFLLADGVVPTPPYALPPSPPEESAAPIPFAELAELDAQDNRIQLGSHRSIRFVSEHSMREGARHLRHLASVSQAKRRGVQEKEDRSRFDLEAIRKSIGDLNDVSTLLRVLSWIMFGYVYVAVPAIHYLRVPGWSWIDLVVLYGLFLVSSQFAFWYAHRRLLPELRSSRWMRVFFMLLNPAEVVTSIHVLEREVVARYHPLALGRVLLDDDGFIELSSRFLRAARFGGLSATERERIEGFIEKEHGPIDALLPAPEREPASIVYCPRCLEQLIRDEETCPSCPAVPLVRFDDSPSRSCGDVPSENARG